MEGAVASGDLRCRNQGRSYEARRCPLPAFVSPHLPCTFQYLLPHSCLPSLFPEPFCLLEGPRNPPHTPQPPMAPTGSPAHSYRCSGQDPAGRERRAEEGGAARNSIVPWQLLAKGRQKHEERPDGRVRLQLGAGEHRRGALCRVAAWVVMG